MYINAQAHGRVCTLVAPDIVSAKYLQDRLYRRALRTGCSRDWSAFRQSRNHYTSLLRSAKRDYVRSLVTDKKTQHAKLWKYFNYLSKCGISRYTQKWANDGIFSYMYS